MELPQITLQNTAQSGKQSALSAVIQFTLDESDIEEIFAAMTPDKLALFSRLFSPWRYGDRKASDLITDFATLAKIKEDMDAAAAASAAAVNTTVGAEVAKPA